MLLHGDRVDRQKKKKFVLKGHCALKIEMIQLTYVMDDQEMNLLLSSVVRCSWSTDAFQSIFHLVFKKRWF